MSAKYEKVISLTNGNASTGSTNVYTLPVSNSLTINNNTRIGLHTASIYNSIPNIHTVYNNTQLSYINCAGVTKNIDLQQGRTGGAMVGYNDINGILMSAMFANGDYLYNTVTQQNVFFLGITVAPIYNAVILSSLPVPTNAQLAGLNYTNPGGMSLPAGSAATMQFHIPLTGTGAGIASMLGFTAANYPSAIQSTAYYITSNATPNITAVTGLTLTCNLCAPSEFTSITSYLADIDINAPSNGTIYAQPPVITYIPCNVGSYSNVTIIICDQSGNPLSTLMPSSGTRFKLVLQSF